MLLKRLLFIASLFLVSCSLQLPDSSGMALFVTAPVEVSSPSEVVVGDFDKVSAYSFACLYSEMEGGGEAWGSELQAMTSSSTEISVQFKIPSLWVGRTYKMTIYAFKEALDPNFRCPRVPSSNLAWARLGYTKYVVPNSPAPVQIPFVDFYESIPETVIVAPTISMVYPSSGAMGTPLMITGTGFAPGATVFLGSTPCGSVQVPSNTQITCMVPSLAEGIYDITVINGNGSNVTQSGAFTYVTPPVAVSPTITLVSPPRGKQGTQLTIFGTGFQSGVTIRLSNVLCPFLSESADEISCTVPDLGNISEAVSVQVMNPDGSQVTLPGGFTFDSLPPEIVWLSSLTLSESFTVTANFQLNEFASISLHANDETCRSEAVAQSEFPAGPGSLTTSPLSSGSYTFYLNAVDQVANSICIPAGTIIVPSPGCNHEVCGTPGDGCYDDSAATSAGVACLIDGTQIDYVTADPNTGFKVWRDHNTNLILKATGLWSSSADWQMKLNRNGKSFDVTFFTDFSELEGRACPTNVYLGPSNMTGTGECLYYDRGNSAQALTKDTGTFGEDYLIEGLPVGTTPSWYQGNIKTCADKGMRLPTLYETLEQSSFGGNVPSDASPVFGGTRVPAFGGSANWTATPYTVSGSVWGFWQWLGTNYYSVTSEHSWPVRCVLHGQVMTPSKR